MLRDVLKLGLVMFASMSCAAGADDAGFQPTSGGSANGGASGGAKSSGGKGGAGGSPNAGGNGGASDSGGSGSTQAGGGSTQTSGGGQAGSGGSSGSCSAPPAPAGTWTFIDVAESSCGEGSPTGFAIYPQPGATKLLIYLQGGGGCFDWASCSGMDSQHQAAHLDGYSAATFKQEQAMFLGAGTIFDRAAPQNPFKDYNFVFVPYCTGDFHSGGAIKDYGGGLVIHHTGYSNFAAFLSRIVPSFCGSVDQVVLAGSSAGGAGTFFNYAQTAGAFTPIPVDLVDDSFPLEPPANMSLQTQMRAAWGAAVNDPPGCSDCNQGWHRLMPFLSAKYPARRFSLISSYQDPSICFYFGNPSPSGCKAALFDLYQNVLAPLPNLRTFGIDSYNHVWFQASVYLGAQSAGTSLTSWLAAELSGANNWPNIMP